MNKNNAKDFLPLVQALADGKTIQYKGSGVIWKSMPDIGFSNDITRYRIKPEPREFKLFVKNGSVFVLSTDRGQQSIQHHIDCGWELITVVEKLP